MKKLSEIRRNVAVPALVKFSNEALLTSEPVIRPLWTLDPSDVVAASVGDEFLIGDEILVAPVLREGARARDVYLPNVRANGTLAKSVWVRGGEAGGEYQGGQWIYDAKVNTNYELRAAILFMVLRE